MVVTICLLSSVLRGHRNDCGLLNDFCDGSTYSKHPLFSVTLEIMIYYDDVEVCNPLGSRSKKHKLGKMNKLCSSVGNTGVTCLTLFYYILGNIPPKYRSSTRAIQLLVVLKSSVLQQYGADMVLEPVMKDIKQLEKVKHNADDCILTLSADRRCTIQD